MININNFINDLNDTQVSNPENMDLIKRYIENNETITFFSWKLFDIRINNNVPVFNNSFNKVIAEKYIAKEKYFIQLLNKYKIKYRYFKIVPNDLTIFFFGVANTKVSKYLKDVRGYFTKIEPKTKVVLFTELMSKEKYKKLYCKVYNYVLSNSNNLIDKVELKKEIRLRSKMYSNKSFSYNMSKRLAISAFALFAAESTIIYYLSRTRKYKNMVLLAGARSINTYKYDFFKYPKNRDILPKLFVI